MLLSVFVDSGVQVLCMIVVALGKLYLKILILYILIWFYNDISAFVCLGFLSAANQASLITNLLIIFVCFRTLAGYMYP